MSIRNQRFRFTEDQEALIAEGWRDQTSMRELARQYGGTVATIRRVLERQGTYERRTGAPKKVIDGTVLANLGPRWQSGESLLALAKLASCTAATLRPQLEAAGYQPAERTWMENHPGWKGGRYVDEHGYARIRLAPDHPYYEMRNSNGYAMEHRVIMALHLGRTIASSEQVHHKNGDRADNRLENLQLVPRKHHPNGQTYRCYDCGSQNVGADRLND